MVRKSSSGAGRMLQWLGLSLIILIADQFTKVLVIGFYELGASTQVTSFFNLVRAHNSGAAFSFLSDASGWQRWFFSAIGLLAAVLLVWLLKSLFFCAGLHPGRCCGQCDRSHTLRLCHRFS